MRDGLAVRGIDVCGILDRVDIERWGAKEDRGTGRHDAIGVRRAILNAIVAFLFSACTHRIANVSRNGCWSQLEIPPRS
jgi:hypothetical protein